MFFIFPSVFLCYRTGTCKIAVPNLLGTKGWFYGRQCFHRPEQGGGGSGVELWGVAGFLSATWALVAEVVPHCLCATEVLLFSFLKGCLSAFQHLLFKRVCESSMRIEVIFIVLG